MIYNKVCVREYKIYFIIKCFDEFFCDLQFGKTGQDILIVLSVCMCEWYECASCVCM